MALFIRMLGETNKSSGLSEAASHYGSGVHDRHLFEVDSEEFRQLPGAPFAYWVGESVIGVFQRLPPFEGDGREAKQGLATADDFRFVRVWWEINDKGSK